MSLDIARMSLHYPMYYVVDGRLYGCDIPRITCPNSGMTISLEDRKEVDFGLITEAAVKKSRRLPVYEVGGGLRTIPSLTSMTDTQ